MPVWKVARKSRVVGSGDCDRLRADTLNSGDYRTDQNERELWNMISVEQDRMSWDISRMKQFMDGTYSSGMFRSKKHLISELHVKFKF